VNSLKLNPKVKETFVAYCKERDIPQSMIHNALVEHFLYDKGLIDLEDMEVNKELKTNPYGIEFRIPVKRYRCEDYIVFRIPVLKETALELIEFCETDNLQLGPIFGGLFKYILQEGKLYYIEKHE
jgi:hypothetical protein